MLLFVITFVVVRCVAWATMPDPTWISGMYGEADFDDQTTALLAIAGAFESHPAPKSSVIRNVVALVATPDEGALDRLPAPSSESRSPPKS